MPAEATGSTTAFARVRPGTDTCVGRVDAPSAPLTCTELDVDAPFTLAFATTAVAFRGTPAVPVRRTARFVVVTAAVAARTPGVGTYDDPPAPGAQYPTTSALTTAFPALTRVWNAPPASVTVVVFAMVAPAVNEIAATDTSFRPE
ncbi:hypothetical protein NS184_08770 [Curtobacterium luteum]|uniref:Uncharacterized protein n=1 Tax=Curtobacterium luteum TaxID=33881 RepID=A0A175RTN4_9MICO|nr:hypothetical protein NS184_08770 [Curtobacterium luteum]